MKTSLYFLCLLGFAGFFLSGEGVDVDEIADDQLKEINVFDDLGYDPVVGIVKYNVTKDIAASGWQDLMRRLSKVYQVKCGFLEEDGCCCKFFFRSETDGYPIMEHAKLYFNDSGNGDEHCPPMEDVRQIVMYHGLRILSGQYGKTTQIKTQLLDDEQQLDIFARVVEYLNCAINFICAITGNKPVVVTKNAIVIFVSVAHVLFISLAVIVMVVFKINMMQIKKRSRADDVKAENETLFKYENGCA